MHKGVGVVLAAIAVSFAFPLVALASPPIHTTASGTLLSHTVSADMLVSSALTRELVDWRPVQPGLIADLEQGHYFKSLAST